MRDTDASTTANSFSGPQSASPRHRSRLVQVAAGPEAPETRDRAGAQRGMAIILIGGGLFWAGVASLVVYLTR